MAKSWVGHNKKVFQKAIEEYKNDIEKKVLKVLTTVAREMLVDIADAQYNQGDGYMPFYSGNLRDSTGLGVYHDGALDTFIPPKVAEHPQNYWQIGHYEFDLWGFSFIQEALSEANNFNKGIWVVLYSTIPYAKYIDDNGSKYWDTGWFSDNIVQKELLPKLKTAFAQEFPSIAQQLNI